MISSLVLVGELQPNIDGRPQEITQKSQDRYLRLGFVDDTLTSRVLKAFPKYGGYGDHAVLLPTAKPDGTYEFVMLNEDEMILLGELEKVRKVYFPGKKEASREDRSELNSFFKQYHAELERYNRIVKEINQVQVEPPIKEISIPSTQELDLELKKLLYVKIPTIIIAKRPQGTYGLRQYLVPAYKRRTSNIINRNPNSKAQNEVERILAARERNRK
jgi:hypothetical protein